MGIDKRNHSVCPEGSNLEKDMKDFGLKLVNDDPRRSIYTIVDVNKFLDSVAPKFGAAVLNKARKYFDEFPDGLKQFFSIKRPPHGKTLKLGNHYHTPAEKGGAGREVFIFTDIPSGTHVKLEEYKLGRGRGKIRYDVATGTEMNNEPYQYHTIETDGPFSMIEIFEDEFKPEDLKEFNPQDWSKEDQRLVKGT